MICTLQHTATRCNISHTHGIRINDSAHCNTLQNITHEWHMHQWFACCKTLQHTATLYNTSNTHGIRINAVYTATHHTHHTRMAYASKTCTPQHIATQCNTIQHVATRCNTLQHTATHCNTLRHNATRCNTLQHTATHSNTLQHTRRHTHLRFCPPPAQRSCDVLQCMHHRVMCVQVAVSRFACVCVYVSACMRVCAYVCVCVGIGVHIGDGDVWCEMCLYISVVCLYISVMSYVGVCCCSVCCRVCICSVLQCVYTLVMS